MVNFISIFSIASLVLSGIVSATSDGSNVRRHHVSAIQRRAAHDHQAAVLADRNLHSSPSDGAAAARRKARRAAGRCKARNTTSTDITSTSTDSPSTTTSLKMVKTTTTSVGAPGNPGGDPTTTSNPTTTKHTTTSTHTTSKAAKTTSVSSGGGGGSGTTYSGDGTYYGTGLGSCGITNKDTDYIVAVSHLLYDSYPGATANPNDNPVCGKKIEAHYGGNSVTVTVVDRCTGCAMDDLDFSPSAFSQLADQSLGRIKITWQWAS